MAAYRLQTCVQDHRCFLNDQRACFAESSAYCLDAGYPKECGQMEPEGSCGAAVK